MKNFKKYIGLSLATALLWSCTYDAPEKVEPTSGSADFSKVVAVGNSLTAGFMDAALYDAGQNSSYAAIVALQMQAVGGGDFNIPMTGSDVGCYNPAGGCTAGRLVLKGLAAPKPSPIIPGDPSALAPYSGNKSALNNFGVPGITLATALTPLTGGPADPGNPAYNPYYARFASNPGTSTIIGDAAAALADGGTFLLFWLGNNDVLGYATGGASNPAILTSESDFSTRFSAALGTLLQANADANGAVANIPNVTDIPYFTTVDYNPVPLDQATADQLNAGYSDFNNGIMAYNAGMLPGQSGPPSEENQRPTISFAPGNNAVVIEDETLPDLSAYGIPSIRQTTSNDLIVLSAGAVIGVDMGGGPKGLQDPLGDEYVLIPSEIDEIGNSIAAFNQTISSFVSANSDRLVLVDINSIFEDFAEKGTTINGSALNASISPPFGGFSLDGVHPNGRGSAFVANKFIEAINAKFNASIPLSNPNNYGGNALPIP
ncbi:hypothetical protein C900_01184 [Fulvivirga imtechensis AK7]|uniref:G-D-S-L family lipolytic protein n=1 Tax=Fulvivirga imtechensis AK7 TaxID=1237149 RepID=L8JIG3_9BACT|nr:hypothetical protein [Fulvivirga imtechensis]ELR68048.1 hypothetical protein C900_01184 [Fulvivirga imtechensis AK7]